MEQDHLSYYWCNTQCCRYGENLARAILNRSKYYQCIDDKNKFYLQEIIHATAFINESVCGSSTINFLRAIVEAFWVVMGILFLITGT